jgi:hypothetical protein
LSKMARRKRDESIRNRTELHSRSHLECRESIFSR